jgi:hypothetical protein
MKKITLFGFLVLTSIITFGQTISISGTVNDQNGKPIPFAFISDARHPYATFSDQNGIFSLKADPTSVLIVTAINHPEVSAQIDSKSDFKIVMTGDPSGSAVATPAGKNVFAPVESSVDMTSGSLTQIGTHQDTLHGSRFLFKNWVHGFAVTPNNSIKQNDAYLFNYDKIDGNLVFSSDKNTAHLVIKQEIKGFTLFDNNVQPYVFEDVPAIDTKHYMQVLASGSKYKIYKDLGTKFIKNNYSSNGISSTGNNYDEYADESVYYVVKLPEGKPLKVSLRKKAIKTAFIADADKVNKFLADNDTAIDDNYLKKLGDYMNQ